MDRKKAIEILIKNAKGNKNKIIEEYIELIFKYTLEDCFTFNTNEIEKIDKYFTNTINKLKNNLSKREKFSEHYWLNHHIERSNQLFKINENTKIKLLRKKELLLKKSNITRNEVNKEFKVFLTNHINEVKKYFEKEMKKLKKIESSK